MKDVNISFNDIHQKSKEYLKQFRIKWDLNIWKAELEMKTTLQIYKTFKNNFGDEEMYDNRPSSNIKEINCMVCDKDEKEDLSLYVALHCTAYNEERRHSTHTTAIYRK